MFSLSRNNNNIKTTYNNNNNINNNINISIPNSSSYDKNLENIGKTREYCFHGINFNPNKPTPNNSWKERLEKRINESLILK
tara:strand:- start:1888 stop:2133 length:246 start_codon:yes stop_codon:yes gene_type:complete